MLMTCINAYWWLNPEIPFAFLTNGSQYESHAWLNAYVLLNEPIGGLISLFKRKNSKCYFRFIAMGPLFKIKDAQ